MSDYFDRIERHLLDAVERGARRAPGAAGPLRRQAAAARRRLHIGRRPGLLAVAGALLISGSAAAAALLGAQHSRPLSGVVPPYHVKGDTISVAGSHYEIVLTPALRAGTIGWCSMILYRDVGHMHAGFGSGACGNDAPSIGIAIFGSEGGGNEEGLRYELTSPQVAAVRIAKGPTVLTRGGQGLPYGFRAAVFQVGPQDTPHDGPLKVTPLDASQKPVPTAGQQGIPQEQASYWSGRRPPAKGACSISAKPGSGMRITKGAVVTRVIADRGIIGHAFLSCEDVQLAGPHVEGLPFASVLLDARRPGSRPAALPYQRPVPGHPGLYASDAPRRFDSTSLLARRVGDAWLIVTRAPTEQAAIGVLDALRAGPVDISKPHGDAPPRSDAVCSVHMRALRGAQEVSQTAFLVRGPARGPTVQVRPQRLSLCTRAEFYFDRWPLSASVMYATGHRGAPRRLARTRPIPGHPRTFAIVSKSGQWRRTAKRVGGAWLVVQGGSGPAQQRALLSRLRVHIVAAGRPHLSALVRLEWSAVP